MFIPHCTIISILLFKNSGNANMFIPHCTIIFHTTFQLILLFHTHTNIWNVRVGAYHFDFILKFNKFSLHTVILSPKMIVVPDT